MKLHIEKMTCGGCARAVSATITTLDENARIATDPANRSVSVETSAAPEAVLKALDAAGFPATQS
ncbi:heavy-metal-associated domain-containing protein [Paracoccus xiamenensis]|uniref:heavy-metal-associated domain-containing protein n=1 Tax=Paracoccus xiamenensis TaxID=2714901 RepID=UPI00140D98EF|nr:heavy-metal-associated domain-containing protein [Paracoccus xiamenensis]NHF73170.1 heavy-metal-associated domain-containing protein [Paracoccus xiamenensis]